MRYSSLLGAVLLSGLGFMLLPAPASAHKGLIQDVRPEAHLSVFGRGEAGIGARADIALASPVLPGMTDELAISPGLDVYWVDGGRDDFFIIDPVALLQWNFYLAESFSVFPEAGIGVGFLVGDVRDHVDVHMALGVGGRVHLSSRTAIVVRIYWPGGLQIGMTF